MSDFFFIMDLPREDDLKAWQIRALEIEKDIIHQDRRGIPVYFIRLLASGFSSEDLYWHPTYGIGLSNYSDEVIEVPKDYLSYRYSDDRTIQALVDSGILDYKSILPYPVIYNSEIVKDGLPAGYKATINWEKILNKDTNLNKVLSKEAIQKSQGSLKFNDVSIDIEDNMPKLRYKGQMIYKFYASNNKNFLLFKHCFEYLEKSISLDSINKMLPEELQTINDKSLKPYEKRASVQRHLRTLFNKINKNLIEKRIPIKFIAIFKDSSVRLSIEQIQR